MKNRVFTIVVTAAVTSLLWYGWHVLNAVGNRIEHVWLVSSVKAPGRMALDTIQTDLEAGRHDVVKAEVEALRKRWASFSADEDDRGSGIGDIMTDFDPGPEFCFSWQPAHETFSPGIAVNQLRMT